MIVAVTGKRAAATEGKGRRSGEQTGVPFLPAGAAAPNLSGNDPFDLKFPARLFKRFGSIYSMQGKAIKKMRGN